MPFIFIQILHDFPSFNSSDILKALKIINWLSGFSINFRFRTSLKDTRTRDITSSAKYDMHYLNDIMLAINACVTAGTFIADYAVWALLIVDGRTVTYTSSC